MSIFIYLLKKKKLVYSKWGYASTTCHSFWIRMIFFFFVCHSYSSSFQSCVGHSQKNMLQLIQKLSVSAVKKICWTGFVLIFFELVCVIFCFSLSSDSLAVAKLCKIFVWHAEKKKKVVMQAFEFVIKFTVVMQNWE